MYRPLLCPRVIYPGRKSVLTFAALWRAKIWTSQRVPCVCTKHHWRAMDGVSDGRSGRSNIWWPAGWEWGGEQGEATQRWDGGFTLAAERCLHCWICVHATKKKHPEKHKKSSLISSHPLLHRPGEQAAASLKTTNGSFVSRTSGRIQMKTWEYLKVRGGIKSVGHVKRCRVFKI